MKAKEWTREQRLMWRFALQTVRNLEIRRVQEADGPEWIWAGLSRVHRMHRQLVRLKDVSMCRLSRDRLHNHMVTLSGDLNSWLGAENDRNRSVIKGCARWVYSDLVVLSASFDGFAIGEGGPPWGVGIRFKTKPIEFDGVYLGTFTVSLWPVTVELAGGSVRPWTYVVVADDPNPSARDGEITHPHVRDAGLCEGAGNATLNKAGREGRLLDFLSVVDNLLGTYNPSSPYVAIADWEGGEGYCTECNEHIPSGEPAAVCERCENMLCGECMETCEDCGTITCGRSRCIRHACTCYNDREAEAIRARAVQVQEAEAAQREAEEARVQEALAAELERMDAYYAAHGTPNEETHDEQGQEESTEGTTGGGTATGEATVRAQVQDSIDRAVEEQAQRVVDGASAGGQNGGDPVSFALHSRPAIHPTFFTNSVGETPVVP